MTSHRTAPTPVLELLHRIKALETGDGSWPGAEVVDALTDWFRGHGLDPDAPAPQLPAGRYRLQWETVETHEATVTVGELAGLLGIEAEQMDAADPLGSEAYYEGPRCIEDALAEIEGDGTFQYLTRQDVGAEPA